MKKWSLLALISIAANAAFGQVKLPALIRDSMILQRDQPVNIWGWAAAGEKVKLLFKGKTYSTVGNKNGEWKLQLPPTKAGGPYNIELSGKNKIVLKEVLFGDVFLCSGQSNMVHQLNIHDVTYANEIATANYPQIRQYWVATTTNLSAPQKDLPAGRWSPAVGEQVRPFSAVAYFFAKQLHEKYKVPIGIINASVGGTPIQAWTSEQGLKDFAAIQETIAKNKDSAYVSEINRKAAASNTAPVLKDAGMEQPMKWYHTAYEPKGWRNINVPGYWEDQGIKDLNGIVWYRKEVELPAAMDAKAAKVFLGRIVDADELYINGNRIGNTTYLYPQRRYAVPANVLRAGKNIFVVRVTNYNGKGGFVPDKPYSIFAGSDTVDLKGTWQYKVGAVFAPAARAPIAGISLQHQPTALYNAMVAPFIQYNIKAVCWYQGETDAGQPKEYAQLLPALIKDWRSQWKQATLPFLYVQLPGFMEYNYLPAESNWAILRESQLKTLAVPHTAMVVAIDLGEWNDIHPDNKKDVGDRLARAAQKLVYKEDLVHSGPLFKNATVRNNKIEIEFSETGSGLTTTDGNSPADFAIAGADKKFVWAQASIQGNKLVVWSDAVTAPLYVRYAWADNPVNANLSNKEGLPASPFRTDN